jgi:glycosyltransferase involved in cell wall biosynthesis
MEKGIAQLFSAFEVLASCLPAESRPILLYVGDGPCFSDLQHLRRQLLMCDNIIMTGYRRDVLSIMNASDLCVVPSCWQEAFGMTVLEAMALGRPVIASNVGGIPELIENSVSGLLFPPGDETALASAMARVMNNREEAKCLGDTARSRAAKCFTREEQLLKLTNLVLEEFGDSCYRMGKIGRC